MVRHNLSYLISKIWIKIQQFSFKKMSFKKNVVCKMTTILSLPQCFNPSSASPMYIREWNLVITMPRDALVPNNDKSTSGTVSVTNWISSFKICFGYYRFCIRSRCISHHLSKWSMRSHTCSLHFNSLDLQRCGSNPRSMIFTCNTQKNIWAITVNILTSECHRISLIHATRQQAII